jgi:hypothetical protein
MTTAGAACLELRRAVFIDAAIELLQVREIGGEHIFDDIGVNHLNRAELNDHAREQDQDEIGPILLNPIILKGEDLITGRGEAHHPLSMEVSFGINVSVGEGKRELCLECHSFISGGLVLMIEGGWFGRNGVEVE